MTAADKALSWPETVTARDRPSSTPQEAEDFASPDIAGIASRIDRLAASVEALGRRLDTLQVRLQLREPLTLEQLDAAVHRSHRGLVTALESVHETVRRANGSRAKQNVAPDVVAALAPQFEAIQSALGNVKAIVSARAPKPLEPGDPSTVADALNAQRRELTTIRSVLNHLERQERSFGEVVSELAANGSGGGGLSDADLERIADAVTRRLRGDAAVDGATPSAVD